MDLLPDVPGSADATEQAFYVCNGEWDGGTFLSFPKRVGKMCWIQPDIRSDFTELRSDELWTELVAHAPPADKEPFLQKWLFFGLIAEFLGLNEQEDGTLAFKGDKAERDSELARLHDVYTKQEHHKKVLTGRPILDLAPEILKRLEASGAKSDVDARLTQLTNSLELTQRMIQRAAQQQLDVNVVYSIAALGETLGSILLQAVDCGRLKQSASAGLATAWGKGYIQSVAGVRERMMEKGWCRSDIARAEGTYDKLSTLYLLSKLEKPTLNRDHTRCNDVDCLPTQISAASYQPAHVTNSCSCANIEIDVSEIQAVLRNGNLTYPVLKFERVKDTMEIVVSIEERSPDIAYVALSHVWSDGLGNPVENTIPKCQISHLASLLNDIEKRVALASKNEWPYSEALKQDHGSIGSYRLWIDTICCPVEIHGKNLTLKRMPEIYRNAAHVLVLDSTLSSYKALSLLPPELHLRIWAASTWMRRLWTLQEGVLANSLWFYFTDMTVNAEHALLLFQRYAQSELRYWRVLAETSEEFNVLKVLSGRYPSNKERDLLEPLRLYYLQRVIYFRSVSVPSDEPICLSTLLGLDTQYILEVNGREERMIRLWHLIAEKYNGVPVFILFSLDRTCRKPGWRWAPLSLVYPDSNGYETLVSRSSRFYPKAVQGPFRGFPCRYGLRVQMHGHHIRIRSTASDSAVKKFFEEIRRPVEAFLLYREPRTGKLFRLNDSDRTKVLHEYPYDDEKLREYDRQAGYPLFSAITSRKCVLFSRPPIHDGLDTRAVLAEILDEVKKETGETHGLQVRVFRLVVTWEVEPKVAAVYDKIDNMAGRIAAEFARKWLTNANILKQSSHSDALADLKKRMVEMMSLTLDYDMEFKASLMSFWSHGIENAWLLLAENHFRYAELSDTQSDQVWYFD